MIKLLVRFSRTLALAACVWMALVRSGGAAAGPNIVLILADDLGIGDLGYTNQNARAAAGLPAIATPNIDALAARGTSFTRMYSGATTCSPTRLSLLTGFDVNHVIKEHTDNAFEQIRPGQQDKTWGQMLQDAGYRTGMFGKWHVGGVEGPGGPAYLHTPASAPPQKGFDTVFGTMSTAFRSPRAWQDDGQGSLKIVPVEYTPSWPGPGLPYEYAPEVSNRHAVEFIRAHAHGEQPFAAYVASEMPHAPFDHVNLDVYRDQPWSAVHKQYAEMVTRLDAHVGKIIAAIEDPNGDGDAADSIASNTLVIFGSDNGALWTPNNYGYETEFFDSNGPYRGEKSNTLEGGIRSPFLVRWDGVTTPGSVNTEYAGTFANLYPTFAELAGEDTPFGQDGVSMLAAIKGQGGGDRQDALVWSTQNNFAGLNQASWAIQMADWKLIRRVSTGAFELYHITADPAETTNLAGSRQDIAVVLDAVAELEGLKGEPFFQATGVGSPMNRYFSQYKTWAPADGSQDFNAATNWAGGTPTNRGQTAEFWNTSPGPNWLATLNNIAAETSAATVTASTKVLGMEIRGDGGAMRLTVPAEVDLQAYNGLRVGAGGVLHLAAGTVTTARELEIKPGGVLLGHGTVTGYQQVVEGVPEFAGRGLLAPTVENAGDIDILYGDSAAMLAVEGDFVQSATGALHVDLLGDGGVAGADHDQLLVTGDAILSGQLIVDTIGAYWPRPGQSFVVLSAGSLQLAGLQLAGPLAGLFSMSVVNGADLTLTAMTADFDANGVVDGDDLAVWSTRFGAAGGAGDGDLDGDVDGADFLLWQMQDGLTAEAPAAANVPEPAGAIIALGLACVMGTSARGVRRARGGAAGPAV